MTIPCNPKIYHIVHLDRFSSIVADDALFCDSSIISRGRQGKETTIGIDSIKKRRLNSALSSYPSLYVGECVPFYFCPRSVMLYLIYRGNHPNLNYRGGQDMIIHLQADLNKTVEWASCEKKRWVFTLSNAGSYYFEDRCRLEELNEIDWDAINATTWGNCKEGKQAEFLLENSFPFSLVERIGVNTDFALKKVSDALSGMKSNPKVSLMHEWYY